MNLDFTPEEQGFRKEVREFFRISYPDVLRRKTILGAELTRDEQIAWGKILHGRGWGAPRWPVEYGGPGWSPIQQYLFEEQLFAAPADMPSPFGTSLVGPVIYTFGNDEQKRYFLPRILNMTDWWAQGFSEPGAGSDLASLKTSARRDGNHYVVNGQKTWTSFGQYANWIFCLVRTDSEVKPQRGISFLLVDVDTPGVSVRPIVSIEGWHFLNEVFFDDVRVPVENLVGEENRGWDYAKFLLGNERAAGQWVGITKQRICRIKELARIEQDGCRPLIDNPRFREKLAIVEADLKALEITLIRVIADEERNPKGKANPASSILKLKGSELQQFTAELMMEVAGPAAAPYRIDHGFDPMSSDHDYAAFAAPTYFHWRAASIYAGSSEIQRNIIAKAILGL